MSKRMCIILVLCLLIVGGCVAAYFFLRKRKKTDDTTVNPLIPDAVASGAASENSDPVLKRGSRGEDVKKLQSYLNGQLILAPIYVKVWPVCNGKQLDSLVVDGIFGEKTECACQWWFGRASVKRSEIPDTL